MITSRATESARIGNLISASFGWRVEGDRAQQRRKVGGGGTARDCKGFKLKLREPLF